MQSEHVGMPYRLCCARLRGKYLKNEYIEKINLDFSGGYARCYYSRQDPVLKCVVEQSDHSHIINRVIPADGAIAGYLPAPKDANAENSEPDELPGMPETSQDKLMRVYKKALSIAYQAGVVSEVPILKVSINNRLTRAWGRCITTAVLGKPQNCKIEVRKSLVECADELPLLQTLLHEICHTVKDGYRGHKAGFMTAAKKIEAMFSQYRVACATINYKTYGL